MPFKIQLLDPVVYHRVRPHRVAPVRFARAVTDIGADPESPDLDDHGFRPTKFCPAHGPVVGIIGPIKREEGKTVRIKVMRDRIDAAAALFPSVDDASVAKLVFPEAGNPLNPRDVAATATSPGTSGRLRVP